MRISSFIYAAMTVLAHATFPVQAKEATHEAPTGSTTASAKISTKQVTATKIMIYGDSLSAGYGINIADGWVALMQSKLKSRGVEVINASISGETTRGGLSRINGDLMQHKPRVVLFALGANDGLRGLPVKETRKNLNAMILIAKAANAKVIIAGIQIPPNYGLDYATQFRDLYSDLAKQHQVILVPFLLDGIAEKLELFQPDRLHPIAAAQPRILENVMPAVEKSIEAAPVNTKAIKNVKSTGPAK
jgi:acyl-CoA thioesterase I